MPFLSRKRRAKDMEMSSCHSSTIESNASKDENDIDINSSQTQLLDTMDVEDTQLTEVETCRSEAVEDSITSINAMNGYNGHHMNSSQNVREDDVEEPENGVEEQSLDFANGVNASMVEQSFTQIERNLCKQTADETERAKLNVAETGSILSIELVNFMCHHNFKMDFGPRINFIIGRNGSGKSAVLNAIVVGLGGRATSTNRGKGIASFIKSGESQAKIIIKLCNVNELGFGKQAFRASEFGKSITIERNIYSSGGSTYKMKSTSGKVIADKKEVLDDIMRHFNIQVENPICVLNQEVSRNFLNTKNPRDKYAFFMKATLLEDMKNDYANSETDRSISAKILEEKKRIIPETMKDVKDLERKVKLFNQLENHKEKFIELNNEAVWALIHEQRDELNKLKAKINKLKTKMDAEVERLNSQKTQLTKLEDDKNQKLQKINNLVEEVERAHTLYEEFKLRCDSLKTDYKSKESEERKAKTELMAINRDKKSLEQKIERLEQQFSDESHNRRKSEISKLTESIAKLKADEEELVNSRNELGSDVQTLTEQNTHITQDCREISYNINTKSSELNRIKQSRSNRLQKFGPKYPELNRRIEEAHKRGQFRVQPLGPIGNHIELEDYSCALAVELCLKGLIFAYCCDNMSDATVLRNIMKSTFGNDRMPAIVTRKFGSLHDVRGHKVEGGRYKSLLELMIIKESPIANCLIDQLRIEQILFIPDYKVAQELLINRSTAPHNCYQSYTKDGCVMYPNSRDSDYKCYANNSNKRSPNILMQNVDQNIAQYQSEINHLQERKKDIEERLHQLKTQIDRKRKDLYSLETKLKQIRSEVIRSDNRLKELESIGDSPPVEISALQEDLDNHNRQRTQLEKQIEDIKEEQKQLYNHYTEAENQMKAKKQEYDGLLSARHPMKEDLDKVKNDIHIHNQVVAKYEQSLSELTALKADEDKRLSFKEAELENDEKMALETTGSVIERKRASKTIYNQIEQMKRFLDEQENSIGDKAQIYDKYKELSSVYKRIQEEVTVLQEHLKRLKISLDLRRRGYVELRNFYSMMTKFFFMDVLRQKGFSGTLEIYHNEKNINGELKKAKTLEIKVNPKCDESSGLSNQSSYSDTRSLSGGERSYSTVAFILALWESAQSPFKILDEVDVFMDMVTRKISLDAMIEFAAQKSGKQYIFLSPLTIQNLPSPQLIKLLQMPEPQR